MTTPTCHVPGALPGSGAGVGVGSHSTGRDRGCKRHVLHQGPRGEATPVFLLRAPSSGSGGLLAGGGWLCLSAPPPPPQAGISNFSASSQNSVQLNLGARRLAGGEQASWVLRLSWPTEHPWPRGSPHHPAPARASSSSWCLPWASRPSVPLPRPGGGFTGWDVLCLQIPFPPGQPPASPDNLISNS